MKTKQSILLVRMIGVMLLDEPGAPASGIPTRFTLTKSGVELERGWQGERREVIARLRTALAYLEAEEGVGRVIH
jgi:hypothetical protein